MTPTQLDHLRRIDAHLANLLSTAEKRTPGEWRNTCFQVSAARDRIAHTGLGQLPPPRSVEAEHNAAFIASCAGNAEAGWMATRAAIHQGTWLMEMDQMGRLSLQDQGATHQMLTDILAAFPNV